MLARLLFVFTVSTFYLTVGSSLNDVIVTCVKQCTVANGEITAGESSSITFTYLINNAGFKSLTLKYDNHIILTALTSKLSPSSGHDVRFEFASTEVAKDGDKYSFNFVFTKLSMEDNKKIFFFTLSINDINDINDTKSSDSLTLNVQNGPKVCGPFKQEYTIEEGNDDDVLWKLCGNPLPKVTANIGGKYYQVDSPPASPPEPKYIYTVNLKNMERKHCGNKLYLEAKGYKTIRGSTNIIVKFTPSSVNDLNAKYDSVKGCVTLTWSSIEAGNCAVKYTLKYDNEYDDVDAIYYETPNITYIMCGVNITYNFSIKAVVDKISGNYSNPISRTGISELIGSDDDWFPWYYILIAVIAVIIILLCVLTILKCTKKTDKSDNTKGIKTANAVDVYSKATRIREPMECDNMGYREDEEKPASDMSSMKLVNISSREEKGLTVIYGSSVVEDTDADCSITTDIEENRALAEKSSKPDCGETSFTVTFQNIDENPVKLFWKDFEGNEKFCHKINPGSDQPVIACFDYSYIARDTYTNKLVYFKKDDKYDIIFRGEEFGDEEDGVNHVIITSTPEMNIPNGLINDEYENDDGTEIDPYTEINVGHSPDHLVYAEVVPKSRHTSFRPSYVVPSKPVIPTRNDDESIDENGEVTCII